MDVESIKKEFPIFDNKVHNNDLVYLDSANSSQKPRVVIDRIYDFYTKEVIKKQRLKYFAFLGLIIGVWTIFKLKNKLQKYQIKKEKLLK